MAIMIPEKPRSFDLASQEGLIFDALALLPEDYYVFHSFRITDTRDGIFRESETDFVILNRTKGVICLEAKAGQVRYENGCWLYGSGIPMHNGGPFNQASANKYKLMRYISDSNMAFILEKCKFLHAVWFPSVSNDRLRSITLPSEGDKALVLTKEALDDPKEFIDRIYTLQLPSRVETKLSEIECKRLVREIFCPQFNVFPSASFEADLKKIVFHRPIIDDLAADGYRDIVLLTCKTEATSILSDSVNNGKYRNKYLFTTCRKFKGLEADVVILLDVDKTTFEQGNARIFYVGTSRARIKLEIAAILSDDDCKEILMSILNYRGKIRRAQKDLAGALNAIGSLDS